MWLKSRTEIPAHLARRPRTAPLEALNPLDGRGTYERSLAPNDKARVRQIRIVRDYGKYDRREAPQYYADAKGAKTVHA